MVQSPPCSRNGGAAPRSFAYNTMPVVGRSTAAARSANSRQKKPVVSRADRPAPFARQSTTANQRVQWTRCALVSAWFAPLWKYQRGAARFYQKQHVQYTIAALILLNFVCNIVESQVDPFGDFYPQVWQTIEDVFNIIFLIELLINGYAHWFVKFWISGWNIFDVLVVAVGMISVARVQLPGALGLLRMLRAFRVFRLFKRIKSLNRIVVSLIAAVPGIANASFIMLLVMCIYAILGVEFYASFGETGVYNNSEVELVLSVSKRELAYGEEYFGTFSAALFTMFQVLTGESWAEAVARPLIFQDDLAFRVGSAVFFVTFILLNSIVLINVVVAVLLEKCIVPPETDSAGTTAQHGSSKFGHRPDEHSRYHDTPAQEPRIAEPRSVPAIQLGQAVGTAGEVGNAKPPPARTLDYEGDGQRILEQVYPDRSQGEGWTSAGQNSVGDGGGGDGTPSSAAWEVALYPATSVSSQYLDPLKNEVEQLRMQIPMLLMAVQARNPAARRQLPSPPSSLPSVRSL